MNRTSLRRCLALLASCACGLQAQVTPFNTTAPNDFYFPNSVYYADAAATSATIEVSFIPGNRSWSGSVGFSTETGTAQAGVDYTAVEGTLNWAGPALRSFEIPLHPSSSPEERTLKLTLHSVESNCVLSRPEATLVIPPTPPTLRIATVGNHLQLSWPAAYDDYVVETATDHSSSEWLPITRAPTHEGDRWVVEYAPDGQNRFFRLSHNNVAETGITAP